MQFHCYLVSTAESVFANLFAISLAPFVCRLRHCTGSLHRLLHPNSLWSTPWLPITLPVTAMCFKRHEMFVTCIAVHMPLFLKICWGIWKKPLLSGAFRSRNLFLTGVAAVFHGMELPNYLNRSGNTARVNLSRVQCIGDTSSNPALDGLGYCIGHGH